MGSQLEFELGSRSKYLLNTRNSESARTRKRTINESLVRALIIFGFSLSLFLSRTRFNYDQLNDRHTSRDATHGIHVSEMGFHGKIAWWINAGEAKDKIRAKKQQRCQ